jgi:hypothetical protein
VDPRAGLDDVEKRKFFALPGLEKCDPSVVQPVASRYTDDAIPERRHSKRHSESLETCLISSTVFSHISSVYENVKVWPNTHTCM